MDVARKVQDALAHDGFIVRLWTDDVFKVASYAIQSLETELDDADFAVAIAHSDDMTLFRGQDWPAPRDNVVFELGMFMGRLSRTRAILMEPREDKVKLPSDLAGVTTIPYSYQLARMLQHLWHRHATHSVPTSKNWVHSTDEVTLHINDGVNAENMPGVLFVRSADIPPAKIFRRASSGRFRKAAAQRPRGSNVRFLPKLDIRATHSDSHAANAKGSVDFPISSDQTTQFQAGFMQH